MVNGGQERGCKPTNTCMHPHKDYQKPNDVQNMHSNPMC